MLKYFSFKSLCCMSIALSALVLLGGFFSPAYAADGIITTVAGSGVPVPSGEGGFSGDGGPATSAQLYIMSFTGTSGGIAVDSIGNLYIADTANQRIRKVSTNGIITTVAGSGVPDVNGFVQGGFSGDGGPATGAQLLRPSGVAVDSSGNLYIADAVNHCIRKVNVSTGIITTVAGSRVPDANGWGFSGDGGPATSAQLSFPSGIAFDSSGNLYIADNGNQRIRKVSTNGIITTVAGSGVADANGYVKGGFSGDGGPATSALFAQPFSVTVDSSGNLYIADVNNHRIRKVNVSTGIITTVAGSGVADANGYVKGGFSGDGGPATGAQLFCPSGVAVDSSGNLYIADPFNQRIRKVSTNGIITTVAGSGAANANGYVDGGFSGDGGTATSAQFSYPVSLAFDTIGNLYISDPWNNRIRKVTFPTKIINLSMNNPAFGNVTVGSGSTKTMTISNTGDSPLTVTSISYSYPADFSGNWSGTIPAGGSQNVIVTFSPTAVFSYNGTLTVNSDRTSGMNTIAISGTGVPIASSAILTIDDASAIQGKTNAAVRFSLNNSGKNKCCREVFPE